MASDTGSSPSGSNDLGVVVPEVCVAPVAVVVDGDGGPEEHFSGRPPFCCCDRKKRLISSLCVSGAEDSTEDLETRKWLLGHE